MIEIIKNTAIQAVQSTHPIRFMEADIISVPPELSVCLKGESKLKIPKELLVVAKHLTKHKQMVSIEGSSPSQVEFLDELQIGDKVMVASLQGGQSFFILDKIITY